MYGALNSGGRGARGGRDNGQVTLKARLKADKCGLTGPRRFRRLRFHVCHHDCEPEV